jgi:hypothetical protein
VHDTDLVVGTHGRSFWVLDDLTPLRDWSDEARDGVAHLFAPRRTVRFMPAHRWPLPDAPGYKVSIATAGSDAMGVVRKDAHGKTYVQHLNAGDNAPVGALVHYRIGTPRPQEAALSFWTADGRLIRRFKHDDEDAPRLMRVSVEPGLHRFVWDLRYPEGTKIEGALLSAYWGGSTIGPVVAPGAYEVRLEVDGQEWRQPFEVVKDPRISASDDDLRAQFDLLLAIRDKLSAVHDAVLRSRKLREQLTAWETRLKDAGHAELSDETRRAGERLLEAESELIESRAKGEADAFNYPPKVNSKLASLQNTVAYGDARPPQQTYAVFELLSRQADEGIATLERVTTTEVGRLNARIAETGVPAIG